MTDRLYYTDASLSTFSARVWDISDDARRVYLDRTAFYPTSGGQPHDLGTIEGVAIIDVIDEDDRIAHVFASPLPLAVGTIVHGEIDVARRRDYMQQHTGQHLLSALFADVYHMPTVSVHFGDDSSTLDVEGTNIDQSMLREAEARANAIAAENRVVSVSFEDAATATGLRKASDRSGSLRIVTIADLDRSACGGTHVNRTGEIGCILLRRAERTKGNTRIEFVCGTRAVRRAGADAELLTQAARVFTSSPQDVPALVEKQQQRVLDLERETRRLSTELARYQARDRWESTVAGVDGVRRIYIEHAGSTARELEPLAQALIALGGCAVLVTTVAPPSLLFATSEDTNINAGQTLRDVLPRLGGRGGGSPRVAQGTVANAEQIASVAATLDFS